VPIRVVTDSTADLPAALAAEHGVTVVPLSVLFGDEELRDGVDITSEAFFQRLPTAARLPTTSQPSAGAFLDAYRRLADEGATAILSIHISEKLSGTLASARQGAQALREERPNVRIEHLDSGLATLALGIGVVEAARHAASGSSLDDVKAVAAARFARTHLFFVVDTLEYLRRGGRIGRASEFVGTLLNIKPLLSVQEGEVVPIGRVRTRARALDEMVQRVTALLPAERFMAMHATTPDDLDALAGRLRALQPGVEVTTGRIGPVIGVHAGPGLIGCAIVTAAVETSLSP